ncbi:Ig-like domain-containing protein [Hespellia stercorisuis]|uniref:Ig-like domain (Group 2) n=1 Tax=Hespellia stercorisuis DSM 15480 TaxID=1121950 RepID=A0A1M6WNV7_9FIRM|nr:Ig-like domain-containing protein [Hespellia stercorisuis]SHK95427.1 Ig-like domain (group 2) [Hespellia stercorisuis DSM 15480]
MKKKYIALALSVVLTLSSSTLVFAEETSPAGGDTTVSEETVKPDTSEETEKHEETQEDKKEETPGDSEEEKTSDSSEQEDADKEKTEESEEENSEEEEEETEEEEEEIESVVPMVMGESLDIPEGLGRIHSYMGWQCITSVGSSQYKLREAAGMKFDEEGFGRIGCRYVIACTNTYGVIGDYVDFYLEDGSIWECVIGDIKSFGDPGCNEWGHLDGNCIIESVVDKDSWYGTAHPNPGTSGCHSEWGQPIVKAVNRGNYWGENDFDFSVTDDQVAIATAAKKNSVESLPATSGEWISGIYSTVENTFTCRQAYEFWKYWEYSGMTGNDDIPVGAVLIGSGVDNKEQGDAVIYLGDGTVAGYHEKFFVISIEDWENMQTATLQGETGLIGWVWPNGISYGKGAEYSYPEVKSTSVEISKKELSLEEKKVIELTAKVSPADCTNKTVEWSSSDKEIASVDENGVITAKRPGIVHIKAKTADGTKATAFCRVTVEGEVPVEAIGFTDLFPTITSGEHRTLSLNICPKYATNKEFRWTSSDESIASVNYNGIVTAKRPGCVKITAETTDGSELADSCFMLVEEE